jgi:hypothetical protein
MRRFVAVDVDNILWDFGERLLEDVRKRHPDKEIPDEWTCWDEPDKYYESEQHLFDTFDKIHYAQPDYAPFDGAFQLLTAIREFGLQVYIITARNPMTEYALIQWLNRNRLPFDDIYCTHDKAELYRDSNCVLVIDDSPANQQAALEAGRLTWSIKYPYNKYMEGGVLMFNNLKEMAELADVIAKDLIGA